jgi:hypothetical protein
VTNTEGAGGVETGSATFEAGDVGTGVRAEVAGAGEEEG